MLGTAAVMGVAMAERCGTAQVSASVRGTVITGGDSTAVGGVSAGRGAGRADASTAAAGCAAVRESATTREVSSGDTSGAMGCGVATRKPDAVAAAAGFGASAGWGTDGS